MATLQLVEAIITALRSSPWLATLQRVRAFTYSTVIQTFHGRKAVATLQPG